jgi:hypothetical protein
MAINFPDSPTTGQSFTVDNVTWVYDGVKWEGSGSATTVTNLTGGAAGRVAFQSDASTTAFTAAGTTGQIFVSGGTSSPTWTSAIPQSQVTNLETNLAALVSKTNGTVTTASTSSTVVRNITLSTGDPSGGADGDVWMKYTP